MHIDIYVFWAILVSVAGVFFLTGYVVCDAFFGDEREDFTILENGIIDRDNQLKEMSVVIAELKQT